MCMLVIRFQTTFTQRTAFQTTSTFLCQTWITVEQNFSLRQLLSSLRQFCWLESKALQRLSLCKVVVANTILKFMCSRASTFPVRQHRSCFKWVISSVGFKTKRSFSYYYTIQPVLRRFYFDTVVTCSFENESEFTLSGSELQTLTICLVKNLKLSIIGSRFEQQQQLIFVIVNL